MEQVCDELVLKIDGKNKDCEYVMRWNDDRTNFRIHVFLVNEKIN